MSDLNMAQFIGRLGADPDTRYSREGNPVTTIRIACGWKSKDKEGVEWVPVTFFGKLAEIAGQYLRKGSQVYVQGRFKTDQWEQDGQKRYRSHIVADRMQMLGSKPQSGQPQAESGQYEPEGGDFDDDIPFAPHEGGWLV